MTNIMERMTRMEAEMVGKDQRIAVLEAAVQTMDQRIALLEENLTEDTNKHNYLSYRHEVELPPKLEVTWFHFIDNIDRACGTPWPHQVTDWRRSSDSVEANIGMTAEEFYQEAPCKAGDFYEASGMEGWSGDLYIGYVFGRYNNLALSQRFPAVSVGPNNESALADEFVVFYKNLTLPDTLWDSRERKTRDLTCSWYHKIPQGFSCGKGAPPDPTCGKGFDTFRPVPCSQIEVKVLNSEAGYCPRREENERYDSISRPSQPHCWASVNWT